MSDDKQRFARLEELRAKTAEQLGLSVDADVVDLIATLRFEKELTVAMMIQTGQPSGDRLTALSRAISEATPVRPPEVPNIKVQYVEAVIGIFDCPHCHKRSEIPDYRAPPQARSKATPGFR